MAKNLDPKEAERILTASSSSRRGIGATDFLSAKAHSSPTRRCGARCSTPACTSSATAGRGAQGAQGGHGPCASDIRIPRPGSCKGGRRDVRLVLHYDRIPSLLGLKSWLPDRFQQVFRFRRSSQRVCPESRLTPLALPALVPGRRLPVCRPPLLVAGLDARSLLLEAPVLQRDRHLVQGAPTHATSCARSCHGRAAGRAGHGAARPHAAGCRAPHPQRARHARRLGAGHPSAGATAEIEEETRRAGPMPCCDGLSTGPPSKRRWPSSSSARRVVARVPSAARWSLLAHAGARTSAAHPQPQRQRDAAGQPPATHGRADLDLEFVLPGVRARLRALAAWCARRPSGLAVPRLRRGVPLRAGGEPHHHHPRRLRRPAAGPDDHRPPGPDARIHSTVCREEWVYEIREPVESGQGWEAEIRRAPRETWRPGIAGPFFVWPRLRRRSPCARPRVRRPPGVISPRAPSAARPQRGGDARGVPGFPRAQTLADHEVVPSTINRRRQPRASGGGGAHGRTRNA